MCLLELQLSLLTDSLKLFIPTLLKLLPTQELPILNTDIKVEGWRVSA